MTSLIIEADSDVIIVPSLPYIVPGNKSADNSMEREVTLMDSFM